MSTKLTKTTLTEAIFNAVKNIQPDALRTLLELEGGDINAINKNGFTPLSYATYYATKEIVTILLDNGADVFATNSVGETPLHVGAWAGRVDILTILLDYGTNRIINEVSKSTPDFQKKVTAWVGRTAFLTTLLDHGMDRIINEVGKSTPEFQKKFDAFINAKNRSGYTPLDMACWNNSEDAAILLMENGCSVSLFLQSPRFIGKMLDHVKKQAKEKDNEIDRLKRRVAELETIA